MNKGTNTMKKQQLKSVVALAMTLVLGSNAQAGTFNFDSPDTIKKSDGSLLDIGTYATVGHFGDRSASQVAALFAGATTASQVGSVLSANYFAIHAPVQSSSAGLLSYDVEVANNLGSNRNIYAVLARPIGGIYEIGIFAAYDFSYDPSTGFSPDTQIQFDNTFPYVNFFTLTQSFNPDDAGFSGAAPVAGFGSASGGSLSISSATSTVVPEPSSVSLMLFGATALVALRRLRKNI
jgi:hypothetical protein